MESTSPALSPWLGRFLRQRPLEEALLAAFQAGLAVGQGRLHSGQLALGQVLGSLLQVAAFRRLLEVEQHGVAGPVIGAL